MSQQPSGPLPDLQRALSESDALLEHMRRKLDKRLARLSDDPPKEEDDERATLPSIHAYDALGSEEISPRLRRRHHALARLWKQLETFSWASPFRWKMLGRTRPAAASIRRAVFPVELFSTGRPFQTTVERPVFYRRR